MHRAFLLLLSLLAPGCSGSVTQVLVVAHLDGSLAIDQLELGLRGPARSFPSARRPELASSSSLADPQSVVLLLGDELAGQGLTVTVDGLRRGVSVARAEAGFVPQRAASVSAEVWLGRSRDGGLDAPRDAGREPGPAVDVRLEKGTCSPNAFLGCQGSVLQRCSTSGGEVVKEDCQPFVCNSAAGRCNECAIAAAAVCSGSSLVECSADGLKKTTACLLGCAAGACCVDADQDSVTTCAGDCDDAEPNVYPKQTAFFSTATKKGSFDYNCDQLEDKEVSTLVSCVRLGASCEGSGWQGSVPGCGVQGVFISCKPSGPSSCSHDQSQKAQGCR